LKLFLSLAVAGWDGYANAMRHMIEMGEELRRELAANAWEIVNETPLPLVCFTDGRVADGDSLENLEKIASHVIASGQAWISTTRVGVGKPVLRACITNYRTTSEDLKILVNALGEARLRAKAAATPGA
jgi:glutamate/tyrosine decarboxylase-like PLP-dependent enzyme